MTVMIVIVGRLQRFFRDGAYDGACDGTPIVIAIVTPIVTISFPVFRRL